MSLGLSKRQQARNERALQELIKSVPGNNVCADCQTKNPGWASWNLGIFLCMRCAGLHRKLGTHVSKVKSLSMDSWSSDQVESMKKQGNITSNKTYNPKNIKPPIPLDVDEVDAAMERFIRQKYEQRSLVDGKPRPPSRNNTGGRSSEDSPPPLPPKTGKRFGFTLRASSAQYPAKASALAVPPVRVDVNNPTRVYSTANDDTLEAKLATLREMGFPDDQRNVTVLKGLSGNLERTIESLVRLGEGSRPNSRQPTPSVTPRSGNFNREEVNKEPSKTVAKSNNPFDVPSSAAPARQTIGLSFGQPELPQSQPRIRSFAASPTNRSVSYNPFDIPSQQPIQNQPLEQAFQSMQITPQPLFPNSTGGYPSQQQQLQQARYQQSMTPPVPFLPQQYSFISTPSISANSNPFFQTTQPTQPVSTNPFFPQPQQPISFLSQLPSLNAQVQPQPQIQAQSPTQSEPPPPFMQQSQTFPIFQPQQPQIQQQPQFQPSQQSQTLPQPQITPPQHQYTSPSQFAPPNQQPQPLFQQQPQLQQTQPWQQQTEPVFSSQPQPQPQILPQQTGRRDKSSILALYNYPQLAPSPLPTANPATATASAATTSSNPTHPAPATAATTPPASALGAGSRNPFLAAAGGKKVEPIMEQPEIARHMSRESVDIAGLAAGRHSPDAFASLSSRLVR